MKAVTWQGKGAMAVEQVPDPRIEPPRRRHHPGDVDGAVRVRPASLRPARPVHGGGRHRRPRADRCRRGGGRRAHRAAAGRPGGGAVQHQLRHVLDVRAWPAQPVRDDAERASTGPGPASSATASSTARCRAPRRSTCASRSATRSPSRSPMVRRTTASSSCSDVLPTAWQAVEYAGLQPDDTLLVLGAGPIGDMCARIAHPPRAPGDRRRPGPGAPGPRGVVRRRGARPE